MQKDIETFFKDTAGNLEKIQDKLETFEAALFSLSNEAEDVKIQRKKNVCTLDEEFERSFNKYAADLGKFAEDSLAYWNGVREELRSYNRPELNGVYSLYIKNFNFKARDISKDIDKLDAAAVLFRKKIKGLSLKLNIWLLDRAMSDLVNLVTKILFNARDLSKIIEKKTGSKY